MNNAANNWLYKKPNMKNDDKLNSFPFGKIFLMVIFSLAILFSGSLIVNYLQGFKIQRVIFEGEYSVQQAEQIQQQLKPYIQGGFFEVDLVSAKNMLMSISWVREVAIHRVWPNKVIVKIQEQKPVAYWNDAHMINEVGDIFQLDQQPHTFDMPKFYGNDSKASIMIERYNFLSKKLKSIDFDIQKLYLDDRGGWSLLAVDDVYLYLGHWPFSSALQRFIALYVKEIHAYRQDIAYIDLRHSNGFSVGWKDSGGSLNIVGLK